MPYNLVKLDEISQKIDECADRTRSGYWRLCAVVLPVWNETEISVLYAIVLLKYARKFIL